MTNRQRATLKQYSKNLTEIKWLDRGYHAMDLNPRIRRGFRRRANKSLRRHNRAICKDFSYSWQRLPGCGFALRISQ
jgi:hypothetical protein